MAQEESDFVPFDAKDKNEWDLSAPIFEDFYIIGPDKNGEAANLYHFDQNMREDTFFKYLMPDGCKLREISLPSSRKAKLLFASENKILENIVYYKVDIDSHPFFIYATMFEATPLSFPALLNDYVFKQLRYYTKNFSKVPVYKCGYLFVSRHPFKDLFFGLLKVLLQLESLTRNTKINLFLLSNNQKSNDVIQRIDPLTYWPYTTKTVRDEFLNSVYLTNLPVFDESIGIQFNFSSIPFTWQMQSKNLIPFLPAELGFDPIMTWINVHDYVHLLESVILAKHIVVIGSNYCEITKTVSFIPQIMAPFTWSGQIFSFIPNDMMDIFDYPSPYIAGAYATDFEKYRSEINISDMNVEVVINMDERIIEFISDTPGVSMTESADFIDSISALFDDSQNRQNFYFTMTILKLTQSHIFHTITKPMENALECRLDVEHPGTRFIEEKFKEQYSKDNLLFIDNLLHSPNFDILISQMCRVNTVIQSGHAEEVGGLLQWAANIWNELNQKIVTPLKPSPAKLLNIFDPML